MEGEEKMENAILTKSENQNMTIEEFTTARENAKRWLDATGKTNGLTEGEKNQFIDMCGLFNLNPLAREIYCVKYNTKNGPIFNIIVGYEVYIKRANKTRLLSGWRCWIENRENKNNMVAKVEIRRKDWEYPFVHEVLFREYDQHNSMWSSKPETMIKKVATCQAFRLCFPEEMGGLPYEEDELPVKNDDSLKSAKVETIGPTEPNKAETVAKVMNADKPKLDFKAVGEKIKALSLAHPDIITEKVLAEARENFKKGDPMKVLNDLEALVDSRMMDDNEVKGASDAFDNITY